MKQFWTHKDNIPEGAGYGQFSFQHFIWLILTAALITGFVFVYGETEGVRRITLLRSVGITLIAIDILKMIIIGISDIKFSDYLPLELCSYLCRCRILRQQVRCCCFIKKYRLHVQERRNPFQRHYRRRFRN